MAWGSYFHISITNMHIGSTLDLRGNWGCLKILGSSLFSFA